MIVREVLGDLDCWTHPKDEEQTARKSWKHGCAFHDESSPVESWYSRSSKPNTKQSWNEWSGCEAEPGLSKGLRNPTLQNSVSHWMVGGSEHFFNLSIYWEESSQLTNIFQRGRSTTNQYMVCSQHMGQCFRRVHISARMFSDHHGKWCGYLCHQGVMKLIMFGHAMAHGDVL